MNDDRYDITSEENKPFWEKFWEDGGYLEARFPPAALFIIGIWMIIHFCF